MHCTTVIFSHNVGSNHSSILFQDGLNLDQDSRILYGIFQKYLLITQTSNHIWVLLSHKVAQSSSKMIG